jgi:uncharacterized OB-fold protein
MGLLELLRRGEGNGRRVMHECRNCGDNVPPEVTECPSCGSDEIASYSL